MMSAVTEDPILRMLADLPPPAPSADRTNRVRSRCHAAIARRSRKRGSRSTASRVVDAACFAVLCVYLAGVVTEAINVAAGL